MALSAGAWPKRKSKKVSNPDFLYHFSPSAFHQYDFNLEEQSNPVSYNQSTKQSAKSSKSKSATVPAAFPLPIATDDTASPTPSFDPQLQLIKLQKDKRELELKVLTISRQECPSENTRVDLSTQDAVETTEPQRKKRNIDWP